MQHHVRPASTNDVDALVRLRQRPGDEHGLHGRDDHGRSAALYAVLVDRALRGPAWSAWLALDHTTAIGCCWLRIVAAVPDRERRAELHADIAAPYVLPDRRRCGVGLALRREAVAGALAAGADRFVVWSPDGSCAVFDRDGERVAQ